MKIERNNLTQEIVKELLDYDPESGILTWKERSSIWFEDNENKTKDQIRNWWNSRFANKTASFQRSDKYFQIKIFGIGYKAHRIIWLWMTGDNPEKVDHENGNCYDNRWINLRNVDHFANAQNAKKRRDNVSGVTGVSFFDQSQKYKASIQVNKKSIYLGLFSDFEEACQVRKNAEIEYGFHQNHGRE